MLCEYGSFISNILGVSCLSLHENELGKCHLKILSHNWKWGRSLHLSVDTGTRIETMTPKIYVQHFFSLSFWL